MSNWTNKDLGPIDAYALAVAGGYTGTKQQWIEEIANASTNAQTASAKAAEAAGSAEDAEAYGAGTRGGTSVGSSDPAYHNNSKYYMEQAEIQKQAAQDAAATASAAYNVNLLTVNFVQTEEYPAGQFVIYDGGIYMLPDGHEENVAWANTPKVQTDIGTQVAGIKEGIFTGEGVLVNEENYIIPTSLKTLDYDTNARKALYDGENNEIIFRFTKENNVALAGSIGVNYTYDGLSDTDDVWTALDSSEGRKIKYAYSISESGRTDTNKIFFALRVKTTGNDYYFANVELTGTSGTVDVDINDLLQSLFPASIYSVISHFTYYGINSQDLAVSSSGTLDVIITAYGSYLPVEGPRNLKETIEAINETDADLKEKTDAIPGLATQVAEIKEGIVTGEGVLVNEEIYIIPTSLKTLDYDTNARKALYDGENNAIIYRYTKENNVAIAGSIGVNYTYDGLSDTDDVWTALDSSEGRKIKYAYSIAESGRTDTNKIFFALRVKTTGNDYYSANVELTGTSGTVDVDINDLLQSLFPASIYSVISHFTYYGINSQDLAVSSSGTLDVIITAYGSYLPVEGPRNLKEAIETINETKQDNLTPGEGIEISEGVISSTQNNITIPDDTLLLRNNLPAYFIEPPEAPTSFDDDSYMDVKIESIPKGKSFIYFTDTHWDDLYDQGNNHEDNIGNTKHSPELIQYIRQRANIQLVLFGGDYVNVLPNKTVNNVEVHGAYRARQLLGDFVYRMKCTAGDMYLPVYGNHDSNLANSASRQDAADMFLPYSQMEKIQFNNLPHGAVTQYEFEKDRVGDFATGDNLKELISYLKLSYHYDDKANKIRYIVMNSAAVETASGPITTIFGEYNSIAAMYLQLDWYYNVLLTTPENYDVVVTMHMLIDPGTTTTDSPSDAMKQVLIAMGLKTKTKKIIYFGTRTNNISLWTPGTQKVFDFTNANDVGRIVFVIGHTHRDAISIADQSATTYYHAAITNQQDMQNVEIDQTEVTSGPDPGQTGYSTANTKGCKIPIIWTTCDSMRFNDGSGSVPKTEMERGTITEQAIDVFTFVDDGIAVTRFGAGSNRKITMEW